MYVSKQNKISINEIAKFLNINYNGNDFFISSFSSLNDPKNNSLLFFTPIINYKFNLDDNQKYDLKKLNKMKNVALLVDKEFKTELDIPILYSDNPRLDFQRIVLKFFSVQQIKSGVHNSAIIEKASTIGKNVWIGANCYIGNDVEIDDDTKIFPNTTIFGKTTIGKNSVILSNSTIGSEGFSFSYDKKELIHFPSLGSIIIGNDVWIGANCTIEKPQIDKTVIENHVKIDDLVQIGHNAIIKQFTQIAAGTIISGRAEIGEHCWIAPNVVFDNGCYVGKNCIVGTSSLVRKNFSDNSVIAGSPAKFLRKNC
tara:strand:- start:33137 stop:34072 length:936 start_codon:yes stop_codon:yes gene_type:complete